MAKTAFEAPRRNAYEMNPNDVVIIGLDTEDGPEHPLYDDRVKLKLDEGLVRNIMVHGVIQPITITKDPDGRALVVVGRQRVRCAREANKRLEAEGKVPVSVPAITRRGAQADMYGVLISENACRQDDNLVTKARTAAKLISQGVSQDLVAVHMRTTPARIGAWLKLLELEPALLKAVERGEISASQALEKSGAGSDVQKALAAEVRGKKANGKGRPKGAKALRPGKIQVAKTFEKLTKIRRYESSVPTEVVIRLGKYMAGEIDEDAVFA